MMAQPSENHLHFMQELKASQFAVWMVARLLSKWGYPVVIPPYHVAPTADVHEQYSDDGDLNILYKVEVKHVSVNFTNAKDWPFKDFIIDGREQYDQKFPEPKFYIVVSDDYAAVGIVDTTKTKREWFVDMRADAYGHVKAYWVCPLDLVTFRQMEM